MLEKDFVHLHLHSDYSLLDGAIKIKPLAQKLNELGMNACALTDHGNLYGAMSFYQTMNANGIQPIIGCETYLTFKSRFDRQKEMKMGEKTHYHLLLLAENSKGYQNLVKLSSKAFTEGFYYKPRIDLELLAEYSEGLIALTACLSGATAHFLKNDNFDEALHRTSLLRDIFGKGNLFVEIQDHGLPDEKKVIRPLIELADRLDLPTVITNDAHYLTPEDSRAHELLLCIGSGKTLSDPTRLRYGSDQFYVKSADEMWAMFGGELPEALLMTRKIAERCQVKFQKGDDADYLPRFPIPEISGCRTTDEYFAKVVEDGFNERLETVWQKALDQNSLKYPLETYRERIRREIEIICKMGYPGYFLIVWDFIRYAREQGIPVGPGRGSAAGSLIAYCLGITDVDPIEYELLFERFLNPERVSMPDIDIDFCIRGREQVIRHVSNLYGKDSVCQIVTFGTMASKAVIKDVGRAMDLPYAEVDKIAKMIPPPVRGRNVSIEQALEQVPELRQAMDADPKIKDLVDTARRLEGCARHTSVHAAGVVIAPKPLDELIPVAVSTKDESLTTQFAMSDLEKTGMLKMDFLALTTLTIISDCLNTITSEFKRTIDWAAVNLSDEPSMALFGEGKTDAIFQFESPGMQEICKRLKPNSLEDLAALNALYRPGPLDGGMVDDFIARHRGQKQVRYIVPQMKDILSNTHGIIVYQEQIMQLAQKLAGYSLGEADMMRRAMGKKKREEMAVHEEKFVGGAVERGIKQEKAEQIFKLMAQFADYGFNRSHSVAYAYLAFQTAYLKAHYPAHFYASVLSHEADDTAKIYKYAAELREAGLSLLPPDINESGAGFTPVKQTVRFGLSAIKGVGANSINAIINTRAETSFTSFTDFCMRVPQGAVNRKVLESLICAGAFDSFNRNALPTETWRAALHSSVEAVLAQAQKHWQNLSKGQTDLFGGAAEPSSLDNDFADESLLAEVKNWTRMELCSLEKAAIGFYLTSHPLSDSLEIFKELNIDGLNAMRDAFDKDKITVAGMITGFQSRLSKKGNRFAMFRLEDLATGVKCVAWSECFEKYQKLLSEDAIVIISGSYECGDGTPTIIVEEISSVADARPAKASKLSIEISKNASHEVLEKLFQTFDRFPGRCEIVLQMTLDDGFVVQIKPSGTLRVRGCQDLEKTLISEGFGVEWVMPKTTRQTMIQN